MTDSEIVGALQEPLLHPSVRHWEPAPMPDGWVPDDDTPSLWSWPLPEQAQP